MPEYRKKRRNKIFSSTSRGKKVNRTTKNHREDIKMTSDYKPKAKKSQEKNNMRVVRGKKLEQKRKFKNFSLFVACALVIIMCSQIIFPAGIIQTVKNTIAIIGTGSYPIELDSSDTVNVQPMGNYFYVLSGAQISAYSNSGKKLFSHAHGFENPVLKTSKWGAILFEQGETDAMIFSLNGLENSITTEHSIITASISNAGAYALVTESDTYACTVSVFNKYGKNLYEWYSAEDIVNNVAISPNTKKIAVSTFKASGGEFNSSLKVLSFKSADPEFSTEYTGTLVYDINSSAKGSFLITTSNSLEFIKWNNYKKKTYKNDYNVSHIRSASHGTVAVFGRESDPTDNKLAVFTSGGKLKYEYDFKGIISDIRLFGGHIYCMSDTDIYLVDNTGKVLRQASSGFGGVKIVVGGTNIALSVTDNKIEKIKLEEISK